jgi:tRNA modification GTPase
MPAVADTIAAIATPPGRGGVGIIRLSGSSQTISDIAQQIIGKLPQPRYAQFTDFFDKQQQIIDSGLALYFPAPNSFTGEDVLELQAHGGPVIMDMLLQTVLTAGARLAKPGEFSERAFLNDKIDLAQAEAIADLIDASSEQAARSATRSLQGEFSKKIQHLVEALIHLRIYVEAAIDFPEEEIDFLSDGKVAHDLQTIIDQLDKVLHTAKQGALLKEGMTVVIAGKPNAGKSSLLNCLTTRDSAIVTEIAGTTRDVLREHIQIDGLPLHIIDTAGLRTSDDQVEQEGVRRAYREIENADAVLLVLDSSEPIEEITEEYQTIIALQKPTIIAWNKIDLTNSHTCPSQFKKFTTIKLSAKTGEGLEHLKQALKNCVAYSELSENQFIARRRHLDALRQAQAFLQKGQQQLATHKAGELLAEDLLQAQHALSQITGEFTSDDLLGKIFSSFCIGK